MIYNLNSSILPIFCRPSSGGFYKNQIVKLLRRYGVEEQEDPFGNSGEGNYIIIDPQTSYRIENNYEGDSIKIPKHTDVVLQYLQYNLILDIEKASRIYCVRKFKKNKLHIKPGECAGIYSVPSKDNPPDPELLKIGPNPYANYNAKAEDVLHLTGLKRRENKYFTENPNRANRILDYEDNTHKRF